MNVSPILHCKTYDYDFRADELLFAPKDVDVLWARKYILETTRQIEYLDRPRWVVFSNKYLVIAGMTTKIDVMIQNCGFENRPELYNRDIKNRPLGGFIGYVIKKDSYMTARVTVPSEEELCELYFEVIPKRWKEVPGEIDGDQTKHLSYIERSFKNEPSMDSKTISCINRSYSNVYGSQRYIRESTDTTDQLLYQTMVKISLEGTENVSLCTNMKTLELAKNSPFLFTTADIDADEWIELNKERPASRLSSRTVSRRTAQSEGRSQGSKRMNQADVLNIAHNAAIQTQQGGSEQSGGFFNDFLRRGRDTLSAPAERRIELTENELNSIIREEHRRKCRRCKYNPNNTML